MQNLFSLNCVVSLCLCATGCITASLVCVSYTRTIMQLCNFFPLLPFIFQNYGHHQRLFITKSAIKGILVYKSMALDYPMMY